MTTDSRFHRGATDADLDRLAARPRSRWADLVSRFLDPAPVLLVGLTATSAAACEPRWGAVVGWLVASAGACVAAPLGVLWFALRRGWVSDPQVVRRAERLPLLAAVCALVAAGWLVLRAAGAPSEVLAFVAAVLAGVVVFTIVSLRWKISFHVGVLSAMVAVLDVTLGHGVVLPGLVLVALLGWSRWRAGRHDVAQVLAGAVLGAAVCRTVFVLLS